MALSGDDIQAITAIVKSENESQFQRVSEKLELTVAPIRDTIAQHVADDKVIHADLFKRLSNIDSKVESACVSLKVGRIIGGTVLTIVSGVAIAAISGAIG